MGLVSFPFLIFNVPMLKDALVHVRPTAYDRAGKVVPLLSKHEIHHRAENERLQRSQRQWLRANGYEQADWTIAQRFEDWFNDACDVGIPVERQQLTKSQEVALRALVRKHDWKRTTTRNSTRKQSVVSVSNSSTELV